MIRLLQGQVCAPGSTRRAHTTAACHLRGRCACVNAGRPGYNHTRWRTSVTYRRSPRHGPAAQTARGFPFQNVVVAHVADLGSQLVLLVQPRLRLGLHGVNNLRRGGRRVIRGAARKAATLTCTPCCRCVHPQRRARRVAAVPFAGGDTAPRHLVLGERHSFAAERTRPLPRPTPPRERATRRSTARRAATTRVPRTAKTPHASGPDATHPPDARARLLADGARQLGRHFVAEDDEAVTLGLFLRLVLGVDLLADVRLRRVRGVWGSGTSTAQRGCAAVACAGSVARRTSSWQARSVPRAVHQTRRTAGEARLKKV